MRIPCHVLMILVLAIICSQAGVVKRQSGEKTAELAMDFFEEFNNLFGYDWWGSGAADKEPAQVVASQELGDFNKYQKDDDLAALIEDVLLLLDQPHSLKRHAHISHPEELPVFLGKGKNGNFEPHLDVGKVGPGENGKSHQLREEQKKDEERLKGVYGFNQLVSDEISLNRTVPDQREDACRNWDYPTNLPTASVILVFHNEGWTTLFRTVNSIINRSPPQFLHEVVLVDDKSELEHLHEKLEEELKKPYYAKVKLVRNKEREGLIRARNNGAMAATGEVVVFLDAHCEVAYNWLPPLLAPIHEDRTTLSVPVVDGIDWNDFGIHPVYAKGSHSRGLFEWVSSRQFLPTISHFLFRDSFTRKEHCQKKKPKKPHTTVSHIDHQLMLVDSLPLIELGLRSLAGTTQDSGFGEEKTLNYLSRCGCVVAEACGFLAPEYPTCTGVILVPPVDQEHFLTSFMVFQQLLGITRELWKFGLMMNTKSTSIPGNLWLDS